MASRYHVGLSEVIGLSGLQGKSLNQRQGIATLQWRR